MSRRVFRAEHLLRCQVLHCRHSGTLRTIEGNPTLVVVIFIHPATCHMIHVHGQAFRLHISRDTKPVLRRQAGFKKTVTRGAIAYAVGLLLGDLILYVVQGEVTQNGAIAGHLPLAAWSSRQSPLTPAFAESIPERVAGLAPAVGVQRQSPVFARYRLVTSCPPTTARLPVAHF